MKHEIKEILPGSIAEELEISAGDFLLGMGGKKIRDVLDYRFATQAEKIVLEIEKPCGEIWEIEIEKEEFEDIGLIFTKPLMSETRQCKNKCVFCFIDQQPKGLRPSLYVKDDDIRLSFFMGNYVTLTNLSDEEMKRIAGYHLSPLRISVHAADIALRKKMMNCENAANLFRALEVFGDAGIKMHFQVVLCKGINDGKYLNETIAALAGVKGAESLAVVPAGITRHREGLHPLEQFTAEEAEKIIEQISAWQKPFVYAADEWYIMSGRRLPSYEQYGDFPQLDNGVGMLRLFEHEFLRQHKKNISAAANKIGIVTGRASAGFMKKLCGKFMKRHPNVKINVYAIRNDFFGENITVSGLLTGTDIVSQLKNRFEAEILFVPENAFQANSEIMLDGKTLSDLSAELGVPVKIGSGNGGEFYKQLTGEL